MSEGTQSSSTTKADAFNTTRWTMVLAASQRTLESDAALELLCAAYWYPLYAYVRRRGHTREDAEDFTQGFFAAFLKRNDLAGLSAERGKFRAFLLASLKHFLANEWDKSQRLKRGGAWTHLPLDWETADEKYQGSLSDETSPDAAFDREWALALLNKVIARLQDEQSAQGHAATFETLKIFLTAGKGAMPYADAAQQLGMDERAARVAVHRLRKRYRLLLRDEIAQTLDDPAQVDEEMRALFGAFSS
jgi:RNA polymerase sigma factor (sigma-70 family)